MLTPRENFIRYLKNEDYAWTPIIDDQQNFRPAMIPDHVARGFVMQQEPYTGAYGGKDLFGCDWIFEDLVGGSIESGVLSDDIEDWESYVTFPDLDAMDWEGCARANSAYLTTDKIIATTIYTGYFERLISFVGFENAAMALVDEDGKAAVHRLFERLTDLYIDMVLRLHRYFNVEYVEIHDDWGTQRSPMFGLATHEEMIQPYIRRLVSAAHADGVFMEQHSCGKIEKLIPSLIETGMDTWCGQKAVIDKHMLVDAYGDRFKFAVEVRPEAPVDDETAMRMIADAYDEWKGKNVWIIDRACFTPAQKEQMAEYVHARGRL